MVGAGRPGTQQVGDERVAAASHDARVSAASELDPERIEAQERADRESRGPR